MTDRDPERTLKALEDQALDDDLRDVTAMSDDELAAEMRAAGLDPAVVEAQGRGLADRALKPVLRQRGGGRGPRQPMWLAAAAVVLLLGAVAATEGTTLVAWIRGGKSEPILPDNERAPPPPTPREIAEGLRDEAARACDHELWGLCARKLDEAKALDPAGEGEERVQGLRQTVQRRTTRLPEPDKPK